MAAIPTTLPDSPALLSPADSVSPRLRDKFGRAITDLRISITDRCNYRCVYCRDGESGNYTDIPLADMLRLVRILISLGIEKLRLTGGEPLLRGDLLDLVRELRAMRTAFASGEPDLNHSNHTTGVPLDLALTTNAHLLAALAQPLRDAGLGRITISMDAVDADIVARITRVPNSLQHVLAGIRAAQQAGFHPIKINCVLLRGFNDHQIEDFARFSREQNVIVRFIEFMPLEEGRVWQPDIVVTHDEIVSRLNQIQPLVPLPPNSASETALRYTFADGLGEIGIIAPVSRPFCGHCSRIRLTSDGKLRTCLFSQSDYDLYGQLRRGASDADLAAYIRKIVHHKEERHHIGEASFQKPSRSMVHIGG
jgi:cyclic pyranopterin phosphate synthase